MSTELTLYQAPPGAMAQATFDLVPNALELAKQIAGTDFVPAGLRNNVAATLAVILTGSEVGLPPMASLAQVFVVNGRPGMYGTGMRALILSRGHHIRFAELTTTRCTIIGRRRGETNETSITWTLDDAVRAGLAGKPIWKQYPQDMLSGRATGRLARAIFADVILGIPYTVEELQDGFIEDGVAKVTSPQEPASTPEAGQDQPRRTARRTRRETAVPPTPEPPEDEGAPPEVPLPSEEPEVTPEAATGAENDASGPSAASATFAASLRETAAGPDAPANETAAGEHMTPAQQLAMYCEQAGIERADLIRALTGKERGRDITREQAYQVLEAAEAIARGEQRLIELDGIWQVLPVEES